MNLKTKSSTVQRAAKMLLVCGGLTLTGTVYSQNHTPRQEMQAVMIKASGRVTSSDGEPIIGASVIVKGKGTGTITDLDGNFSLNVPSGTTLTISYIGDFQSVLPGLFAYGNGDVRFSNFKYQTLSK